MIFKNFIESVNQFRGRLSNRRSSREESDSEKLCSIDALIPYEKVTHPVEEIRCGKL